ncbi:MAG: tRNA epoxyqueuosine(34) reductase QueG [Aggregatilineales bacterium]
MPFSTTQLKAQAIDLGFNIVGVTPAEPSPTLDAYFNWIDAEMHGTMGYLARPDRQIRRRDLNVILPGVKSMILVGLDYRTLIPDTSTLKDPSRGRIASYAWGVDYHDLMTPRLEHLAHWLGEATGMPLSQRVYVDTGAILERSHAQQAGMGFIGKNTMLIHPKRGSYFFLGEMLTDLEFDDYDTPHKATMCGGCTRCLVACPTNAFPKPFVLDARRCISYLTIEHKGYIDHELRPLMGNWVYGCDVCQEVCPWQRFSVPTREHDFYPDTTDFAAPKLLDLLEMTDETFQVRYHQSPIKRIKRERLVRNACVAAGNWGDMAAIPALERLLEDESPLIRAHAAWGLLKISDALQGLVQQVYQRETDDSAKADIGTSLAQNRT